MGEHGGCGIVIGVFFLVAAIFGAGYLFAADNQIDINVAAAAAAAEETAKAQEAVRLANEAQAAAEQAAAEANAAVEQLRVENAALAEQAALAGQSAEEAARLRAAVEASNEALIKAEALLAETKSALAVTQGRLDVEIIRRKAAEQRAAEISLIIPPSGETGKQSPASLIIIGSAGLGGLTVGALIIWATRPTTAPGASAEQNWRRPYPKDDTVMVKMTRADARAFARWKGRER